MVRALTEHLTGYCDIGNFAGKVALQYKDYCCSCHVVEGTESVQHLLCKCPAHENGRHRFLSNRTFENLGLLANVPLRN